MIHLLACICFSSLTAQSPKPPLTALLHPTLYLGDMAPSLDGATWLRGKPVTSWKDSKLTVIEFWATWCPPCKGSAREITRLSKKYAGTVTFVGMDCREDAPDKATCANRVRKYLTEMGKNMTYPIAMDNQNDSVVRAWLLNAGLRAIPTAFVINPEGRILYVGHPSNLDGTLPTILDGTYNLGSHIGIWRKRMLTVEKDVLYQRAQGPVTEALKTKNYAAAAKSVDKVIDIDPKAAPDLLLQKVVWMSKDDPKGAMKAALHIADTRFKDDAPNLTMLAMTIAEDQSPIFKPDFAVALAIAQQAAKISPNDPDVLSCVALAYFRLGKNAEAASSEAKAIEAATQTPNFDPDILSDYKAKLASYRSAIGK